VGNFIIPHDFRIIDMDENVQVSTILGRSFLGTAVVVINVNTSTMPFQLSGETVD